MPDSGRKPSVPEPERRPCCGTLISEHHEPFCDAGRVAAPMFTYLYRGFQNQPFASVTGATVSSLEKCHHGVSLIGVNALPPHCSACADEAFEAWLRTFDTEMVTQEGAGYFRHGYRKEDMRRAWDRS